MPPASTSAIAPASASPAKTVFAGSTAWSSNAIQTLPEGQGNYNFILNAQGRIQGDCYIYRRASDLLLDTDRSQAARLLAHLDHFIIMDDVELQSLDETTTGIGLVGPNAGQLSSGSAFNASALAPLHFMDAELAGAVDHPGPRFRRASAPI